MTEAAEILMNGTSIRQATIDDIDLLVPLLDQYRQFYRQASDAKSARRFLLDRLQFNQSVIFLALTAESIPEGFTQLFPSFSSMSLSQIWILNDLYVDVPYRRQGIATALLTAASGFAKQCGATQVTLSTEITNREAQALYERHGWLPSTQFRGYNLTIGP